MFFRDMSSNRGFPLSYVKIIDSAGAVPMISWELWIWGENPKKKLLKGYFRKTV